MRWDQSYKPGSSFLPGPQLVVVLVVVVVVVVEMSSVIDGIRQAQCLAVAHLAVSCTRSGGRQHAVNLPSR